MRQLKLFAAFLTLTILATAARGDDSTSPPSRWPMMTTTSGGAQVTIFQPQLEDFQGDQIKAHAAVAVQAPGQQQPTYGAVWLQSQVSIDRVARTVQVISVSIPRTLFPGIDQATTQSIADAVQQALMATPATLSLDQLLEMYQAVQKAQEQSADIQNTPPRIIFLDRPAVKVQYDGEPRLMQVPNSNLLRAVNTPFFVVLDPGSKTYFLKGAGRWFSAPDAMGPFQLIASAPQPIVDLASQSGYTDPQQPVSDAAAALQIVTATDPTELIWTDGQPQLTPISGTDLLYIANTQSDVFTLIDTQQTFVVLSGRWYSAPGQNGPWTYVSPDKLPPDFSRILPDSPKADVLAFVPGTQAAQDAVADTYIPQTAEIDTSNYEQPPVNYDGNPDFVPIQGTDLTYADNCPCPVIQCAGSYYSCYNAVWYTCPQPSGPWQLCTRVPPAIYTISPSCPIYPVRYCYVYGVTPSVLYVGYTPGYTGCYATGGVVVYGTGYYYNAWVGNLYIPRPLTFGFSARYDHYNGHWGFGFALATGGGSLWIGQSNHAFVPGGAWFGYGGYRPTFLRSNAHPDLRYGNELRAAQSTDVYGRNLYQRRQDVRTPQPAQDFRASQPVRPANPDIEHQDVYADPNGTIYRYSSQGWDVRQGDDWRRAAPEAQQPVQPLQQQAPRQNPPEEQQQQRGADFGQLDRDRNAREQGENRSSRAPSNSGSADRGSGGGGGGGRGR